jgi:hypothetical protein
LIALGHVRLCAAMTAVQSFATLIISVSLVLFTDLGIYGVALGAALPMIVTSNVWMFAAGYHSVGGHSWAAARSTVLRWVAASLLFAIPCILVSWQLPHGGWLLFWLKVVVVSIIYVPIGLFVVLLKEERVEVLHHGGRTLAWAAMYSARVRRQRGDQLANQPGPAPSPIEAEADAYLL